MPQYFWNLLALRLHTLEQVNLFGINSRNKIVREKALPEQCVDTCLDTREYINERRPFAPMRKTLRVGNVQATKISSYPSCITVSDFLIL